MYAVDTVLGRYRMYRSDLRYKGQEGWGSQAQVRVAGGGIRGLFHFRSD